jgi:hypothetical protein
MFPFDFQIPDPGLYLIQLLPLRPHLIPTSGTVHALCWLALLLSQDQFFRDPLPKALAQFQHHILDLGQIGRFIFVIPVHQLIKELFGFG